MGLVEYFIHSVFTWAWANEDIWYAYHMYHFVWRKHESMSPLTDSRLDANYEQIIYELKHGFECMTSEYWRHLSPPIAVARLLTI